LIVLDTHAWLWWAAEPQRLSPSAREAIDGAERFGIATISCWEIAMLAESGRIELDRPVGNWVEQALAHKRLKPLPLTGAVAVEAALLGREGFVGDPADRLIYATARGCGGRLVTRDRALRAFDSRNTIW
jgi:PIN domain nuclease of toxin-antitoxin system